MGIILILWCVIAIALIIQRLKNNNSTQTDFIVSGIFGGVVGLIFVVLMVIFVSINEGGFDERVCKVWTTNNDIISINRQSQIQGSFILGTGSIRSVTYYYAYVNTDSGYLLTKYRTNKSYIVETFDAPTVEAYHYSCPKPILSFLLFGEHTAKRYNTKYVINVPKHTIMQEFKL